MPQLRAAAALQVALLLSAVPAQYLISRWSGSTALQRFHATTRLLRIWKEWRESYLNGTAWMDWTNQQMSKVMSLLGFEHEGQTAQESPPIETMMYDNDQGFFGDSLDVEVPFTMENNNNHTLATACHSDSVKFCRGFGSTSKAVRSPRPPYVFLRVGEVVLERNRQLVGVVVSWDPELRAPPEWVDRVYSDFEGTKAERTPHYKVLFSGPGPSSLMVAYLPQTQLERITGMRPDIPTLENYFTHFDGNRFVMQPWLRELFPEDESEDA